MNQNQKLLVESKRTWIQRLFGLNTESVWWRKFYFGFWGFYLGVWSL